ncbi:MAG TPA: cysteine desulfurase CsdA [Deltaproteobacteria bacterium]|nr:cysteine desulfurase CsdA [Deltaproteobacteria bacterium]
MNREALQSRAATPPLGWDVERIRKDFPILNTLAQGKALVYLDNAATSQKPQVVIDRVARYYESENANIHRGVHMLSEKATEEYEHARSKIQHFLGAKEAREIIFVRGATEAINLVAQSFGRRRVQAGDEILISTLEHHSNIVPWQMLCQQSGAVLKVIPITDAGELILEDFEKMLSEKTKLLAVTHVSNGLGTINPVKWMIEQAHAHNIPVLIDGAQGVPHLKVDVQDLDCDFYAFSGHKLFGPTGIGVLYGKAAHLEAMPPYQGGGDMIRAVTFEKTSYNVIPYKFEAGTPNISGAIGLGAATDYLNSICFGGAAAYEHELLEYGSALLEEIPGLRLVGTAKNKASVLSFTMEAAHPHDIGTVLDLEGIAIRSGHHCNMPLMKRLGLAATARASMAFYNTKAELDVLAQALRKVNEVFG